MPPGTPYNSFVLPYRIRVDDFGQSTTHDSVAALHLLSHTHSDHINGLSAQSFGYTVICSKDAKEMLLRHEVYAERELHELDLRAEKTRTYSHLKVDPRTQPDGTTYYVGSRDLLKAVPLDTPIQQELSDGEFVTITLLNANHCPGAVMFLIEGGQGAILHTGDFRAEPWFLESLTRNPSLQPYLAPHDLATSSFESSKTYPTIVKTLEAIYLDTACIWSKLSVPPKERATTGLVQLMKLFPETAYFFINIWTWGYEDILKAIAREFQCQIHVDRYKFSIFQCISDPFLRSIVTRDPSSTRFHACERFRRCEYVAVDNEPGQPYSNAISHMGKRVVYVNPVTMGSVGWTLYLQDTKERLLNGELINNLLVPLSRHSPLPELRDFVALFCPRRVVPNTLEPRLLGLDWRAINNIFADCLHPHAALPQPPPDTLDLPKLQQLVDEMAGDMDMDVALKNLVGDGAADLAERWAENGKLKQKLELVRVSLDPSENSILDRLLGVHPSPPDESDTLGNVQLSREKGKSKEQPAARYIDSEDESEDGFSEDEKGKTAHLLFANMAGIEGNEHAWWVSSPASQRSDAWVLDDLEMEKSRSAMKSPAVLVGPSIGAPSTKPLTPTSPPVRPVRMKQCSPPQVVPAPRKRMRQRSSISPSATPPLLRKRLFSGDSTHHSRSRASPHASTIAHPGKQPLITPVASSSRLPAPIRQQRDLPSSPLLEVKNHPPKRTPAATFVVLKRKASDPGHNITASPETDQNRASDEVSRPARIICESHRRQSPPQRLLVSAPTLPDHYLAGTREEVRRAYNQDRRARRSKLHAQRLRIGERLARARPDLVLPSYESKREALLAREARAQERAREREREQQKNKVKAHLEATGTLLSFETVGDDDGGMDWDRSRMLAEAIKADIANGRRLELPPLVCAETQ